MTSPSLGSVEPDAPIGLHQLPLQAWAKVVSLQAARDEEERDVLLRLLEIGFLPGERVRVIAKGFPGADPLAVRVGHTTFALRGHEAALIRVRAVSGPAKRSA